MLPGKKYAPEDIIEILWRRKWLWVVPFVLLATATLVGTSMLPDRYRAETKVLIVPQRVPQNYVRPTVTLDVEERLSAIREQILSRTMLERIIKEFDLYPEERKVMLLSDVIDQMRQDVRVDVPRARARNADPGFFTVAFESPDPRQAMVVADRVANLFLKENAETRTVLADTTSRFLQAQLAEAKRRLVEHEKKLEDFRRANAGRLPSEVQTNLQMMQNTQVQLQGVVDAVNRDRERQLVLEKLITDLTAMEAAPPPIRVADSRDGDASGAPVSTAQQLEAAQVALQRLELRLTAEHPDVIRTRKMVEELEKKAAVEAPAVPVSPDAPQVAHLTPSELQRQKQLSSYQAERESLFRRVEAGKTEATRLQDIIGRYRARVEAAPTMEAQQTELMRDYGTLQQAYTSLLTKSQESNMAVDLERNQSGEQFKIIDGARLPERPASPNRLRLNLIGAVGGLLAGLLIVALIEYRDSSFRTHDDIVAVLALPVLAMVPSMQSQREQRIRRRRLTAMVSAAALMAAACAAFLVWRLDAFRHWMS